MQRSRVNQTKYGENNELSVVSVVNHWFTTAH